VRSCSSPPPSSRSRWRSPGWSRIGGRSPTGSPRRGAWSSSRTRSRCRPRPRHRSPPGAAEGAGPGDRAAGPRGCLRPADPPGRGAAPRAGRAAPPRGPLGQRQEHARARPRRPLALGLGQRAARRDGTHGDRAEPHLSAARQSARGPALPGRGRPAARPRIDRVLELCGLAHLSGQLDRVERWDRLLSAGELQRLGLARALLRAPDLLVLDEALASLDGTAAAALLGVLREELPGAALLLLAQRPDLAPLFDRVARLEPAGAGAVLRVEPPAPRPPLVREPVLAVSPA